MLRSALLLDFIIKQVKYPMDAENWVSVDNYSGKNTHAE